MNTNTSVRTAVHVAGGRLLAPLHAIHNIPSFLQSWQCEELMRQVAAGSETSTSRMENGLTDSRRTSSTLHLSREATPEWLWERLEEVLPNASRAFFEPVQLTRYEIGQRYMSHLDVLTHPDEQGQRVATVLVYLNTVDVGGETVFHHAGCRVAPRSGDAVIFFPADHRGSPHKDMLHEALPPLSGPKFVLQAWMRQFPCPALHSL